MTHAVSPQATGGAGPFFEQHTDAAFLVLLLTGGASPFFTSGTVVEVDLQCGHAGWKTDDLLVQAKDPSGVTHKAVLQVKRHFVLSTKEPECVDTFRKAFLDFRNRSLFDPSADRLGLIVGPASDKLLKGFRTLLDCARASLSFSDMDRRLQLPAYLGSAASAYQESISEILKGLKESPAKDQEIWEFLRIFEFTSLDLNTSSSYTETLLRSLLSLTALEDAPAAIDTWNQLVVLVSNRSGSADSLTRSQLPTSLTKYYRTSPTAVIPGLARLQEDTDIVVRGVSSAIAGQVQIERTNVVDDLIGILEKGQVVLITGEAGAGKSGVAKEVFARLLVDGPGYAFRAESFAGVHINLALFPHGLTLKKLDACFALHARKVLWIDGLERLLEKPDRAAFQDLLMEIKRDASWKVLITCRDYSTETVRSAFFEGPGLPCLNFQVPELTDGELDFVASKIPALSRPMSDPTLRELFRIPFFLDKAARLAWPADQALPMNQREFRAKVWRDVVRHEAEPAEGLPQLRAKTFMEIAIRRAQALEPFVPGDDLDPRALQRLRQDSLVLSVGENETRLAPAHDVLEDWAVMQWLDDKFQIHGRSLQKIFELIGTYPALRRAFRKWLTESMDVDPAATDALIIGLFPDTTMPAHWRDDTIVAALLSRNAANFLLRNAAFLLANNAEYLCLVVHLLRVAGKKSVSTSSVQNGHIETFFVPFGSAWGATAQLLAKGVTSFGASDFPLILGFLEDWNSITYYLPRGYPSGHADVETIVMHWLPQSASWRFPVRDAHERLLKILLRIPKTAEAPLREMIKSASLSTDGGRANQTILELIYSHFYGAAVCRDLPDLYVEAVKEILGLNRKIDATFFRQIREHTLELESTFGLNSQLHIDSFPPSAFHGPFFQLLCQHPGQGVNLILRLLNHSCDAYGDPNNPPIIEPPEKVQITLPDGKTRLQWGNWRLWGLYRSMSVGPYALQSALMALEKWLLQKATRADKNFPTILTTLLSESNNVAITSVVASVAIAYPTQCGAAALSVLTCQQIFQWDRIRHAQDLSHSNGSLSNLISAYSSENAIYEKERQEAAILPHRQRNLETLALNLQISSMKNKVFELIDDYKKKLPPESAQDDEVRVWRLALHRMDLRNFVESEQTADGHVLMKPVNPPEDVQKMIDRHQPRTRKFMEGMRLSNWGMGVFEQDGRQSVNPEQWREMLQAARRHDIDKGEMEDDVEVTLQASGPEYIASVCIRDHWNELSADERVWCVDVVCKAVDRHSDTSNSTEIVGTSIVDGSRPAAFILPFLIGKDIPANQQTRVINALATAIIHAVEQVVAYAVQGVASYLWAQDRSLALTCLQALLDDERESFAHFEKQRRSRAFMPMTTDGFLTDLRVRLRTRIAARTPCDETQFLNVSFEDWPDRTMINHLLTVFTNHHEDSLARQFMTTATGALVKMWAKADDEDASNRTNTDSKVLHSTVDGLARFTLQLSPEEGVSLCGPIIEQIALRPKETGDFLRQLIRKQDQRSPTKTFWSIWQSFADAFRSSDLSSRVDEKHSDAAQLLSYLFLNCDWKASVADWTPLQGNAYRISDLFKNLPVNQCALSAYCRFLSKIGEQSLPDALIDIVPKLGTGQIPSALSEDSVFYLESILKRLVYGGNHAVRANPNLKSATLAILDALVAFGSSPAFKLRDDLLTPGA
jgi:hypothetical protein